MKSLMRYCPEGSADGTAYVGHTAKPVAQSQTLTELSSETIHILNEMDSIFKEFEVTETKLSESGLSGL